MELKFGDIVLLQFPFTNTQSFKKRPALVIKDTNDGDIIVCRITSKIYTTFYDIEFFNWKEYGLKLPSVVRIHKIASLEFQLIESKIGHVNSDVQQIITKSLIALFKN